MENIELYNLILSATKSLNQEVLNSCSNHLMLTGVVPEKYRNRLKKINAITGNVFDILLSDNYEYMEEDNIIKIHVEEEEFVCLKDQIEFFNQGLENTAPALPSENLAAMTAVLAEENGEAPQKDSSVMEAAVSMDANTPIEEAGEDDIQSDASILDDDALLMKAGITGAGFFFDNENPNSVSEEAGSEDMEEELLADIFDIDVEPEASEETPISADTKAPMESVSMETSLPAEEKTFFNTALQADTAALDSGEEKSEGGASFMDFNAFMQSSKLPHPDKNDSFAEDVLADDIPVDDVFVAQTNDTAKNAQEKDADMPMEVYTEQPVNSGMQNFTDLLAKASVFPEENNIPEDTGFAGTGLNLNEKVLARYTKKKDEFVFISYKIRVMTPGLGNMKDMSVMIAPLAIPEGACPSAPIITSIVCDGRISTKSSYEMEENGKNMLVIRVNNEYEFLVRGFFSSSGTFGGFVATTGKSVERGDKIEVLEERFYGKADIHTPPAFTMHYNEAYDPAQAYIFPLINDKKDNFIFFEKTAEFTEYMYDTEDSLGLQKIMITDNGVLKEVVCQWEGDEAVIKVLEVQHEEF